MTKTCTVDGLHVKPCATLAEATEYGNPPPTRIKKTGIFAWAFYSRETRKPSRTLYGAKTSQHANGLIFNFCPWCGADLKASHADDPIPLPSTNP